MKANETTDYAQMGVAALLPGMQHMLTLMQGQLDEMRAQLAQWQSGGHKKRGRPRKIASGRSGWPGDPEERSREMKRRMALWKPAVESELSKKRKAEWAALSPRKRRARLAAMAAGKAKKAPVVKLEAAS